MRKDNKYSLYGLPEKVEHCSKCLMTNQKPFSVNEMKHGKLLPGVRIPIQGKNGQLDENPPDNVLVLAWNFFDYI